MQETERRLSITLFFFSHSSCILDRFEAHLSSFLGVYSKEFQRKELQLHVFGESARKVSWELVET